MVALGQESKARPEQKKELREEVDQNVQFKPSRVEWGTCWMTAAFDSGWGTPSEI